MATSNPGAENSTSVANGGLNLTEEQRSLWDKCRQAAQRWICVAVEPNRLARDARPRTALERLTLEQQFLTGEVERIESVKQALQALYETLTPDQREILDRDFMISGAGSASAVLANAFSTNPTNRVFLLQYRSSPSFLSQGGLTPMH